MNVIENRKANQANIINMKNIVHFIPRRYDSQISGLEIQKDLGKHGCEQTQ